jgi:hypothetical protein
MGTAVLECPPLPTTIPPNCQVLPKQLHGVRLGGVEIVNYRHWIPLMHPVKRLICALQRGRSASKRAVTTAQLSGLGTSRTSYQNYRILRK